MYRPNTFKLNCLWIRFHADGFHIFRQTQGYAVRWPRQVFLDEWRSYTCIANLCQIKIIDRIGIFLKTATYILMKTDQRSKFSSRPRQFKQFDCHCFVPGHSRVVHHRGLCGMVRPCLDPGLFSSRSTCRNVFHARNSRLALGSRPGRRSAKSSATTQRTVSDNVERVKNFKR